MWNTTLLALIGAGGTVGTAVVANAKGWFKKSTETPANTTQVTAQTGDISGSLVAIGDNNTQIQGDVHHYPAVPLPVGPFAGKVPSTPSMGEIYRAVLSVRSPYQSEQMSKSYIGLFVSWPVSFYFLHASPSHMRSVTFVPRGAEFAAQTVWAKLDLHEYPELKSIPVGSDAWIEGRIESFESWSIRLEDGATVTFA